MRLMATAERRAHIINDRVAGNFRTGAGVRDEREAEPKKAGTNAMAARPRKCPRKRPPSERTKQLVAAYAATFTQLYLEELRSTRQEV
jgi:hypothetical protein